MALDMFLKMSNGISGESKDKDKATVGDIDVLAWSWGCSQSGTFHQGGGGGAGKANVQDISLTKWIDKASPKLQLACLAGTHITECVLNVRKAGDKPYVYLKITMTKCLITSVSTGGSGGEDRLTENVSINFAKVKVEYFEQTDTGSVNAAGDFTFDIEANAKS
ncbi:MAG: type VI secretion system tube protein Hcp [Beijerinckiaceae bacterium]|jgi:type VI secretion system secreted protein Hcp|nr:type VI secretion system tube protein Hcp [Beijerinckiaceae bacterium]